MDRLTKDAQWLVRPARSGGLVTAWTEDDMKRAVSLGRLSGAELVKPETGGDWQPLHTLAWFAALAGVEPGSDMAALSRKRAIRHPLRVITRAFGSYIGVVTFASSVVAAVQGKPAALAGGAVIGGGLAWWITSMVRQHRAAVRRYQAAKNAPPESVAPATAEAEPLDAAVAALEREVEKMGGAGVAPVSPGTLRRCAEQLREQRRGLESVVAGEDPDALVRELGAAREKLAEAREPSLVDALGDQIRALEERQQSMERARQALLENDARRRALLHEVEALRLRLGRSAVDGRLEDETFERLAELTRQINDASEEARSAARAKPRARALGPG